MQRDCLLCRPQTSAFKFVQSRQSTSSAPSSSNRRQLLVFKDIPISTSTLARLASNNNIQTTIGEQTLDSRFNFTQGPTRSQLSFHFRDHHNRLYQLSRIR